MTKPYLQDLTPANDPLIFEYFEQLKSERPFKNTSGTQPKTTVVNPVAFNEINAPNTSWVYYFKKDSIVKPIKFVYIPGAKTPVVYKEMRKMFKVKKYLFVLDDPHDYTIVITDSFGQKITLQKVTVIDEDSGFLENVTKGEVVWIPSQYLHSMPHEQITNPGTYRITDPGGLTAAYDLSKVTLEGQANGGSLWDITPTAAKDIELAQKKLWYKKNNGYIFTNPASYNIVVDTKARTIENPLQQLEVEEAAREAAVKIALTNLSKRIEDEVYDILVSKFLIIARKIEAGSRTSSYKVLVRVNKGVIDALPIARSLDPEGGLIEWTHQVQVHSTDMAKLSKYVSGYLRSLNSVASSVNLGIDLKKEAEYLDEMVKIFQEMLDKKRPPEEPTQYTFYFNEAQGFRLVALKYIDFQGDPDIIDARENLADTTSVYITNIGDFVEKNKILQRVRTLLYFINMELFTKDIGTPGQFPYNNKPWVPLLAKYTFQFPDVYTNNNVQRHTSEKRKANDLVKKAEQRLGKIPKSLAKRRDILAELTPQVKGYAYDARRTLFLKLQDPSFASILGKKAGDSKSLYSSIINKFSIGSLIGLAAVI